MANAPNLMLQTVNAATFSSALNKDMNLNSDLRLQDQVLVQDAGRQRKAARPFQPPMTASPSNKGSPTAAGGGTISIDPRFKLPFEQHRPSMDSTGSYEMNVSLQSGYSDSTR